MTLVLLMVRLTLRGDTNFENFRKSDFNTSGMFAKVRDRVESRYLFG